MMEKLKLRALIPDTEVVKLKGGFTLSLKNLSKKFCKSLVLCRSKKPQPSLGQRHRFGLSLKRIVTSGGRTITIPPRNPVPATKKWL